MTVNTFIILKMANKVMKNNLNDNFEKRLCKKNHPILRY